MTAFAESVVEEAALAWLESLGWSVKHLSACGHAQGGGAGRGELAAERTDYGQVVLEQRLRDALARLNPTLPAEALDDAFRKLASPAAGVTLEPRDTLLPKLLSGELRLEDAELLLHRRLHHGRD